MRSGIYPRPSAVTIITRAPRQPGTITSCCPTCAGCPLSFSALTIPALTFKGCGQMDTPLLCVGPCRPSSARESRQIAEQSGARNTPTELLPIVHRTRNGPALTHRAHGFTTHAEVIRYVPYSVPLHAALREPGVLWPLA